ncbi:MAG: hypothetical protein AB2598_09295 [Candidatus Thiodiazotropha sp.]
MFDQESPHRTIKQFVKDHPAFTEGGIRYEIFNCEINGLRESGAILRNGRKLLIHVPRYFRWLDEKNGIQANDQKTKPDMD